MVLLLAVLFDPTVNHKKRVTVFFSFSVDGIQNSFIAGAELGMDMSCEKSDPGYLLGYCNSGLNTQYSGSVRPLSAPALEILLDGFNIVLSSLLLFFCVSVPDLPTDLRAVNVTDTTALLLWRPALAAVDKYAIVYGSGTGEGWSL